MRVFSFSFSREKNNDDKFNHLFLAPHITSKKWVAGEGLSTKSWSLKPCSTDVRYFYFESEILFLLKPKPEISSQGHKEA